MTAGKRAAPRRRPRQERARFTVAAILEAAVAVIDDVGWAHASTNRIADRAGVSIGSLYQYFPNKEAILSSLYERHHRDIDRVVERTMAMLADPKISLGVVLRRLFDDLIELHRSDPVLARILSTEVPLHPVTGPDHADSENGHRLLVELLAARPDVGARRLEEAARVLEISVEALTRWLVHEAPPGTDLESFVDESVAMLAGYLGRSAGDG